MQAQYQEKHSLQGNLCIPKACNVHTAKRVHAKGGYATESPRKSKLSHDYKKTIAICSSFQLLALLGTLQTSTWTAALSKSLEEG